MRILFLSIFLIFPLLADIGTVGAHQGSASLVRQGESLTLFSGMTLQEHDAIMTKTQSKVQLIMKDETIITIGPSSHFEINAYSFTSDAQNNLNLRLQRGFFRTITGKIGKIAPERFKIQTKSATIGIRGTDFAAYVDQKTEYIACFSGRIKVKTSDEKFELDTAMMVVLDKEKWRKLNLDIEKFRPLLYSNTHSSKLKNIKKDSFDTSEIESINQQERLQNSNFAITPGYEVPTPLPPFIP